MSVAFIRHQIFKERTMSVSATNPAGALTAGQTRDRGISSLKSEDFFKILITELQQQDPLEPTKTQDMINSVSQIRSIELSKNLTDTLAGLAQQQRTAGTSDLIGKYVLAAAETEDGGAQPVEGVVTSVRFMSDGNAVLELDSGMAVRSTDVLQITTPEQAEKNRTEAAIGAASGDPAAAGCTAKSKFQQKIESALGKLFAPLRPQPV